MRTTGGRCRPRRRRAQAGSGPRSPQSSRGTSGKAGLGNLNIPVQGLHYFFFQKRLPFAVDVKRARVHVVRDSVSEKGIVVYSAPRDRLTEYWTGLSLMNYFLAASLQAAFAVFFSTLRPHKSMSRFSFRVTEILPNENSCHKYTVPRDSE